MNIDYVTKDEQNEDREVKNARYDILFIHVTEQEALDLICSLSNQLAARNTNFRRDEKFATCGTYFSIGVDFNADSVSNSGRKR